jgi:hypothetical protein
MSAVILRPGGLYLKDPNEARVVQFDFDTDGNLATAVTISTSTWTITVEAPASEVVSGLTKDNPSILSGSRKTQVRLTAGTLGSRYRLTNQIVTSESPTQTKEYSVFVEVVNK